MKKTYKIVPFDIELAKKIQAGEIEGKMIEVITKKFTYNSHGCIAIDQKVDKFIELLEEAPKQYPYDRVKDKITDTDWQEAKKTFPNSGNMQSAFISGVAYQICREIDNKEEAPKHEFKPFDKVLVRGSDNEAWRTSLYESRGNNGFYVLHGIYYRQCVPYEGHEYLIGTTDKPLEG